MGLISAELNRKRVGRNSQKQPYRNDARTLANAESAADVPINGKHKQGEQQQLEIDATNREKQHEQGKKEQRLPTAAPRKAALWSIARRRRFGGQLDVAIKGAGIPKVSRGSTGWPALRSTSVLAV